MFVLAHTLVQCTLQPCLELFSLFLWRLQFGAETKGLKRQIPVHKGTANKRYI